MSSLSTLAFLLVAVLASSAIGHESKLEPIVNQDEETRRTLRGQKSAKRLSTTTINHFEEAKRVIVTCTNKKSMRHVLNHAKRIFQMYPEENMVVVELTKTMIEFYKNKTRIERIEEDHLVYGVSEYGEGAHFDFDNAFRQRALREVTPWGMEMIQVAPDQLGIGSWTPTVCIVDTGFARGHPDLPSDATGDTATDAYQGEWWPWYRDLNGHGTHVSGVVAAISGNDLGVTGAGLKIHVTRGLNDQSKAYESDIRNAVENCRDAGANVISLSLGGGGISQMAYDLFKDLVENRNIIVVAAAGNQGKRKHMFPGSHPNVISVGAVNSDGDFWSGSNYNSQVELAAPGVDILSTTTSNSAVHTADFGYPAYQVRQSPDKELTGKLINCGSDNNCDPTGGICLVACGWGDKTRNLINDCDAKGGIAAILYNSGGDCNWHANTDIPAVAVSETSALELIAHHVNEKVSIGLREGDEKEYTYDLFSGTSMATPHVAAAAAVVWSHAPDCSNHQIRYALAATAEDRGLEGCDWDYGYGIVKAKAAVEYLKKRGCDSDWARLSEGGCTTLRDN